MGFNHQSSEEGLNEINMTPFVDVVLVLLVIFMVTAPAMVKETLKVKLPKTNTSDGPKNISLGIAITREGQILLDGKLHTLETFQNELKEIKNSRKETTFLISADAESYHGKLVEVIDALKKEDLNQFALQVEKIKKATP